MNKQEAKLAMQEGEKVTHRYFTPNEWMTMKYGMIALEDGVICPTEEFWQWRTDPVWDDGYKLFNE